MDELCGVRVMKKENILSARRLLCILFAFAALFVICSVRVSAEDLVTIRTTTDNALEYSEYAQSFNRKYLEVNLRFRANTHISDKLTVVFAAPEGFSFDKEGERTKQKKTVELRDTVDVNCRLFPQEKIDADEDRYLSVTVICGSSKKTSKLKVRLLYSSDSYTATYNSFSGSMDFMFSERMFEEPADKYNNSLALASFAMAASAYSSDSTEENYTKMMRRDENIRAFFKDLGFKGYKCSKYSKPLDDAGNSCAYAMAYKEAEIDGEKAVIVGVAVRGGGYGAEWSSNFCVEGGSTNEHLGFAGAGHRIARAAEKYISNLPEKTKGYKVYIWISGYSRGAAASNIAAAALSSGHDVYAYTFATPATVKGDKKDYKNIFNIVSKEDPVPQIPLKAWGYTRYGRDIYTNIEDADAVENVKKFYEETTGDAYNDPVSHSKDVEKFAELMYGYAPTSEIYRKYYQNELVSYIADACREKEGFGQGMSAYKFAGVMEQCYLAAVLDGAELPAIYIDLNIFTREWFVVIGDKKIGADAFNDLFDAHYPESYLGYLSQCAVSEEV